MSDNDGSLEQLLNEAGGDRVKPKGFFDALTDLQHYAVAEKTTKKKHQMDGNIFTLEMKFEYFMIGLKSMLIGGILMVFMLPLAVAAFQQKLPVFGNWERTWFDQMYVITLSFSIIFANGLFYLYVTKFNVSKITQSMIWNLFSGVTFGLVIKTIVSFILYNCIYFFLINESTVTKFLRYLGSFESLDIKNKTLMNAYEFIMGIRPIFISSAFIMVISTTMLLVFLWVGYVFSERRKIQI